MTFGIWHLSFYYHFCHLSFFILLLTTIFVICHPVTTFVIRHLSSCQHIYSSTFSCPFVICHHVSTLIPALSRALCLRRCIAFCYHKMRRRRRRRRRRSSYQRFTSYLASGFNIREIRFVHSLRRRSLYCLSFTKIRFFLSTLQKTSDP